MKTAAYEAPDPRFFRAFLAAAETLSFTEAARRAGMTQSGVSQHVAKLEEQLGAPLFLRIGKAVQLTATGRALIGYIERQSDQADRFFETIRTETTELTGVVRYAMPPGCLMSPHLPRLLQDRRAHPGIDLAITIAANAEVHDLVRNGEVHFGFVTQKLVDSALAFSPFCEEEFVLTGAAEFLNGLDEETLNARPFIIYPGFETLFAVWRRRVFPRAKVQARDLRATLTINGLEGALVALKAGAGLTVLARHCLDGRGTIPIFQRRGLSPVMNRIHVVTLKGADLPRRVRTVLKWFEAMF